MQTGRRIIRPYQHGDKNRLLLIWEASVLATHHFLNPDDFKAIREEVMGIDFAELPVYCLEINDTLQGFMCVMEGKLEMLFLHPEVFRQGMGRMMLNYAIDHLGAKWVDVNEQNSCAIAFYEKFGFVAFQRNDKDDQGRNYPVLRMRLENK